MKEEWKDIKGYEGLYQVSNCGRIKSLNYNHTNKEKIRKKDISNKGYECILLCKNASKKKKLIHRIVAETFIPNPENKPQVNHIDGNKKNNNVKNLEWVTNGENEKHAYENNMKFKHYGKDNGMSKPILKYDLNWNFIEEYDSIKQASKENNIGVSTIVYCLKGKTKKPTKYYFKYKEV